MPITLENLIAYSTYLNETHNGIRYSANTYNKRLQGAKERKIYIPNQLIYKVKNNFQGQTFLFEHNGKQYNRIALTQRITIQGKIILNKNISAHTLRHPFASHMLKKTNNLKGVSKYLGHSSTSTTSNLNIHHELQWKDIKNIYI